MEPMKFSTHLREKILMMRFNFSICLKEIDILSVYGDSSVGHKPYHKGILFPSLSKFQQLLLKKNNRENSLNKCKQIERRLKDKRNRSRRQQMVLLMKDKDKNRSQKL